MSKDEKPYTLEELAAEFKEGCVCPNPEQHAALAAPNKPDPIYCVRVSDWTRLRATVEALDEALADNAALLVELAKFLPAHTLLSQPHPGSALLEQLKKAEEERDALRSDLVQANGRVNEERYDHAETCLDLEAVKAARLAALDGQIAAESRLAQAEAALREMREYAEEVMEESDEETTGSTALDHFINLALAAPASSPLLAKLKAAKKMVQALGMVTGHFPANNPKGERAEFICRSCAKEVSEALRLWKEAGGEG